MNSTLKNKAAACVLVLIVVALGIVFASDVTVQQGNLTVDGDGSFDDVEIDVLDVGAVLSNTMYVENQFLSDGDVTAETMGAETVVGSTMGIFGKVVSSGGYDPPYVLYDQQTREQIIEIIKKEVPPEKLSGAALFFNSDTKRLETYVANEGRFYDLQGNVVHSMPKIEAPTTAYEDAYYLEAHTGTLQMWQKPVYNPYKIKHGFALDKKTGQFLNTVTGEVVSREEALEIYVENEGNFYDMDGKFIRSEAKE